MTRPPFARVGVLVPAVAIGVLLSVFSAEYGYERDELYFRLLRPAWGYVDQGPLTPLLARAMTNLFTDATWAVRIPATLVTALSVVVVALLAREFGGGRGAQSLAAWGFAFAALPVIFGHVLLTATPDLLVWPVIVLCVVRVVLRPDPRWWLAVGAIAGISTYNKLLVAVLLVSLAAGLAVAGPWRALVSWWFAAGVLLGLVLALPNLVFQVTHGWPELAVGRALSEHNAGDVRVQMWWFLALMLGPPLVPVWIAGLVRLWRVRATRFVAIAFPVLLVLVFVMGSQFYYPVGLVSVLFGVGCVPALTWLSAHARSRRVFLPLVGVNAAVSLVLGLPLVPVDDVGSTPVAGISQVVGDSVGWPRYVAQVGRVYRSLPAAQRRTAVVYASNYGEAGAVSRYGGDDGLPARVYSGQNQLWYDARPPETATTVVFVGGQLAGARALFSSCAIRTRLDNGVDVDNEEQDEPVAVCRAPRGGWAAVWPRLKHLD